MEQRHGTPALAPSGTRRRHPRIVAALVVTLLSIALAEVSIGSQPWAVLDPRWWILMVPVYGCQTLLIAALVLKRQPRPTLATLWSAGAVMGLYEFSITRMLWDSSWDTPEPVLGIDLYAFIIVAGLWHPFMSVIFPLLIAEQLLIKEPHIAGLFRWRGRSLAGWVWAGVALAGLVSGGMLSQQGSPVVVVASLTGTALVVWAVCARVRRRPKADAWVEVLPNRTGMVVLWVVVGMLFGVFTVHVNTVDPVPLWIQGMAWLMYALFIGLTVRNMRHDGPHRVVRLAGMRAWVARVAIYVAVSVAASLVAVTLVASVVVIWGVGAVIAVTMLAIAFMGALRRPVRTTKDTIAAVARAAGPPQHQRQRQ